MKKFISMLMAVAMLCALLAGCGESKKSDYTDDEGKDVTLVMAIPFMEQKDTSTVEKAINEKLEKLLPHTKLSLMLDYSMADKWSLWMSTQKAIDIAHSGYVTDLEEEVRNKTYLELNDLVDEYAPDIKELKSQYWYSYDNASINGTLYAIPNIQYYTKESLFLKLPNEFVKHIDMAALVKTSYANDKTTKEFYDILTAGLTKAAKAGVDCSKAINSLELYGVAKRGYTFIGGDGSNLCYDVTANECKIIDFYTTEAFATYCKYTQLWSKNGWISKDILTGTYETGINAHTSYRYNLDKETKQQMPIIQNNITFSEFDLNNPETQVITTDIGENKTYYSIPFTSENPVRAIKFLNLINSEKGSEVLNMLAFGIEGQHYEVLDKENGDIKAFEYEGQGYGDISYGIPNWMAGNMMLMYNVAPYTHSFKAYGEDYYLNRLGTLKKHALYGYSFATDAIRSKFNKVIKNNGEYAESIYCGVVNNTDALLAELTEKNKTAGIEEVIAELQKQADKYISSNH